MKKTFDERQGLVRNGSETQPTASTQVLPRPKDREPRNRHVCLLNTLRSKFLVDETALMQSPLVPGNVVQSPTSYPNPAGSATLKVEGAHEGFQGSLSANERNAESTLATTRTTSLEIRNLHDTAISQFKSGAVMYEGKCSRPRLSFH
jgi:hypothetical protein